MRARPWYSVIALATTLTACGASHAIFSGLSQETLRLVELSGARAAVKRHDLPKDTKFIVGSAIINFDETPVSNPQWFRLGLMIYPDEGEPITDFFRPYLRTRHEDRTGVDPYTVMTVPVMHPENPADSFKEHFPDHVNGKFELTFRDFARPAYYLTNPPKGTAYVWIQTSFDGHRITQLPLVVRLEPGPEPVTRLDIYLDRNDVFRGKSLFTFL